MLLLQRFLARKEKYLASYRDLFSPNYVFKIYFRRLREGEKISKAIAVTAFLTIYHV